MATVSYETIQKYLDAIDNNATLSASGAPHGKFWKDSRGNNLTLTAFKSLAIPNVNCNGSPVTAFNPANPDQSPLYLILIGPWCNKPQMPKTGPFITDPGYTVTIDGAPVTGDQIKAAFLTWIKQEFPATANP
jgi:hypothetical protein